MPGPKPRPLLDRIMDMVSPCPNTGCWFWTGALNAGGYAVVSISRTNMALAHRELYKILVGPIPDGLDLDHECHNKDLSCAGGPTCIHRSCINPEHVDPATREVNLKRGRQPNRTLALFRSRLKLTSKTTCKHGHAFTEENTGRRKTGQRFCKQCKSDEQHRAERWKKAA